MTLREEYDEMIEENQNVDSKLYQNEITLQENETIITSYEKTSKAISTNNESITESYKAIIAVRDSQIAELKISSKEQKTDSLINSIKRFFGGFIWGALAGLFGGLYLGISIN